MWVVILIGVAFWILMIYACLCSTKDPWDDVYQKKYLDEWRKNHGDID